MIRQKNAKKILGICIIVLLVFTVGACSDGTETEEAVADTYPEKQIDVYVGHGAGGGTDNFVRTVTSIMGEDLGVNINVINQEGGSGVIAMKNAMQQPADGYSIIGDSAYAATAALESNEYTLDEVIPIARLQSDTFTLQVKEGTFESIDELIEYAKEHPGELKLAGVGPMGNDELNARLFMKEAGVEMTYVPMEGAGPMHSNLLGGHIDVMLEEIGPTISYIEEGNIVPLVAFTDESLEDFPDIPTTVEKGWDLTTGVERYLMIHADAPSEVVEILEESAKKAYESEKYQEYEESALLHYREGWMGSEEFTEKLKKDIKRYREVAKEVGMIE